MSWEWAALYMALYFVGIGTRGWEMRPYPRPSAGPCVPHCHNWRASGTNQSFIVSQVESRAIFPRPIPLRHRHCSLCSLQAEACCGCCFDHRYAWSIGKHSLSLHNIDVTAVALSVGICRVQQEKQTGTIIVQEESAWTARDSIYPEEKAVRAEC
jgi:hypothetical protein